MTYGSVSNFLIGSNVVFSDNFSWMYFCGSSQRMLSLTKVDLSNGNSLYTHFIRYTGLNTYPVTHRLSINLDVLNY